MPDPFVGQELQTVVATLQNMVVGISNLTKGLASFTPAQASHDPLMGVPAWPTPNFYQKLTHVTAAGNYQIHSQACILWGFTLNNAANKATMTVYDGIGGGTVLANFDEERPLPRRVLEGRIPLAEARPQHIDGELRDERRRPDWT